MTLFIQCASRAYELLTSNSQLKTKSDVLLDNLARNFFVLNYADDFSAHSNVMPPPLQAAIVEFIMSKKSDDDIWISRNDIISALIDIEKRVAQQDKATVVKYIQSVENGNRLLLADGVTSYQLTKDKTIFVCLDEWKISSEDAEIYMNEMLPLTTQVNLASTCRARSEMMEDKRFWQAKFNRHGDTFLDNATEKWNTAFSSFTHFRSPNYLYCDKLSKAKLLAMTFLLDNITTYQHIDTKPKNFGPLTIRKIINGELTIEDAKKKWNETAQQIESILASLPANDKIHTRLHCSSALIFDGLITTEHFMQLKTGEWLNLCDPDVEKCIYENLITLNRALQLSEQEKYALTELKEKIADESLTLDQVLTLTRIEVDIFKLFIDKLECGTTGIYAAALFIKESVLEVNLYYENFNDENDPELKQGMNNIAAEAFMYFSAEPNEPASENECLLQ